VPIKTVERRNGDKGRTLQFARQTAQEKKKPSAREKVYKRPHHYSRGINRKNKSSDWGPKKKKVGEGSKYREV